jgi:membrane-bound lytic murein transglycosylase B
MQNDRKSIAKTSLLSLVAALCLLVASPARADKDFVNWINDFYPTAAKAGISKSTYIAAFKGVTEPDPEVLRKADYQPEFKHAIWDYLDSRVNPYTVGIGQDMLRQHGRTLSAIERHFGVDKHILLAIWSMESNYGAVFEKPDRLHNVPRALATLAYADKSRAKFARTQLIAALKILEHGDVAPRNLTGSWAGAMGHTQFIPTSYLIYAYDADGNGKRDIWNSVPDALATAANLLAKNGWRSGQTWGYEVALPAGGKLPGGKMSIGKWADIGVTRANGKPFTRTGDAAELKALDGRSGPAFLATKNFFVLKAYNNSDKYALAVGLLADEIAGYGGLVNDWKRPFTKLSFKEKQELQKRLLTLGYYEGELDGKIGSGSREAIKAFQSRAGMAADGHPSMEVLSTLRQR